MAKYDAFAATALRLIKAKGALTLFTRDPGASVRDPVTGVEGSTAAAKQQLYAVGLPPGKSAEFKIGSLVGRNVIELYVATKGGDGFIPQAGDKAPHGGKTYTILTVTVYDPAGDGVIFVRALGEL